MQRVYYRNKLKEFGQEPDNSLDVEDLKQLYRDLKAQKKVACQVKPVEDEAELLQTTFTDEGVEYDPIVDEIYATQEVLERMRKAEIVKQNLLHGGESPLLRDRGGVS